MREDTLYVGLDTDKKHIDVAVAEALPRGEVRYWGKIANETASVDRLIKRLRKDGLPDATSASVLSRPDHAARLLPLLRDCRPLPVILTLIAEAEAAGH